MFNINIFIPAVFLAVILIPWLYMKSPPSFPELDLEEWWGPENETVTDEIISFSVEFNESMIADLKDRLRSALLVTPLEGIAFEYGFNGDTLANWVKYWDEKYPFSEREEFCNKYPHFKTNIQGLDIHFVRVTPEVPSGTEVLPMLMLHGWPGSVLEFHEALEYLTAVNEEKGYAMEFIIPSLPGFGYSDAAVRPGLGPDKMAVVMRNLMHRLGYKKFYVQGGDWGSTIAKLTATFFSEEVLGLHTVGGSMITSTTILNSLLQFVLSPTLNSTHTLSKYLMNQLGETGYTHLQSTRPDTIGMALSSSPAGLLAYILEKFSTWTYIKYREHPDGGLTSRFHKNQLLDNVMFYWVNNCMSTAMRIYAEMFNTKTFNKQYDEIKTSVPTIVIQPKHDLISTSTDALERKYINLLRHTYLDQGGHFLAMELPKLFAEDVQKAIEEFRAWHENNDSIA